MAFLPMKLLAPALAYVIWIMRKVCSDGRAVFEGMDCDAPPFERTVRWDDVDIGIDGPRSDGEQAMLSPKDEAACFVKHADAYA
jgi:hypothetical protein